MHGWPYDPRVYDAVVPSLDRRRMPRDRALSARLRPDALSVDRRRRAPASRRALGNDLKEFMDALGIERAALAGYDWGGRAACIVAALWPERARCLVTGNGYNIQDIPNANMPAAPEQEQRYWYQYYFHTERGRAGLTQNRRDFMRLLWRLWSPNWHFDDATFDALGAVVGQSRFRRRHDPVLSPSLWQRAGRSGAMSAIRATARRAAGDHGADNRAARRRQRRRAEHVDDVPRKVHRPMPKPRASRRRPQCSGGGTASLSRKLCSN